MAGVAGGALSARAVLIVGVANLLADELSMGVGNYLGIRSQESVRRTQALPEEEASPARHGLATFLAFVGAGTIPLLSYIAPNLPIDRFLLAALLTFGTLFTVGALRSFVTSEAWWWNGLEMLGLGVIVAATAYSGGALVAQAIG